MVRMTENRKNWLYPEASGLYFPHDGFVMRATDGKQYDYEEECELLNEYDKKYNEYRKDVLRLEEELDYYKTKCSSLEEGLFQQDREIAKLEKENKELKKEDELFFGQVFDILLKYQDLFNREMADALNISNDDVGIVESGEYYIVERKDE